MSNKRRKKHKDINWSAEENFDKNRSIIYIEHSLECPIFAAKAEEFYNYLKIKIPERQFILIRNSFGKTEPRSGAFEIEFSQHARTLRHNLWSGLDKGPPRRDKFPKFETLMPEVQKIIKKFYPDIIKEDEDGFADATDQVNPEVA